MSKSIGVIGAGSFGTTVAQLIAKNQKVMLYARRPEIVQKINQNHSNLGYDLSKQISATNNLKTLADQCDVIFPVIPSANFRMAMKQLGSYVTPRHILIHGTKGMDVQLEKNENKLYLSRANIHSMSEVIHQETNVMRVGCLSGPNLSKEIMEGLPTATVLASQFDEVIEIGQKLLANDNFFVFGSSELRGAEFAGAYKNVIALGSGILKGAKMGKNLQALLITRGLHEMIYIGKAVGIKQRAFLGTAGIGDLIATSTSSKSRNFTFGKRIAQGETMEHILAEKGEIAEGVRTVAIAYGLSNFYKLTTPITKIIYKIIYNEFPIKDAMKYLMSYPFAKDVDFLD